MQDDAALVLRNRLRGMLLAGACGDALGAPIEFLSLEEIEQRHGPGGPETYPQGSWPRGHITDDTQMTLFTAEGMLRSVVRGLDRGMCNAAGVVHGAYLRWLYTQGVKIPRFEADPRAPDGWLIQQTFLHEPRVPGNTCLSALHASMDEFREKADNDSKGCGSVMRTAPVAAWDLSPYGFDAFEEGCAYAALTHAHPTGILAAGFQSRVLALLLQGVPLGDATGRATTTLRQQPDHEETLAAVEAAVALAGERDPSPAKVERLGAGWIAEEALAIALYAALVAPDVRSGLRIAVTHSGDSDSTGAIAGNLLGAIHGVEAIPSDLLEVLEGREVIERMAEDLLRMVVEGERRLTDEDKQRYPGW